MPQPPSAPGHAVPDTGALAPVTQNALPGVTFSGFRPLGAQGVLVNFPQTPSNAAALDVMTFEMAHFIMERRMMLTIKSLAERGTV